MKIYGSTRQFNSPREELDYYINKICNQDVWLAVRQEDIYNKWIKAYTKGDEILFSCVYNSAWFPKSYFYEDDDKVYEIFGKLPKNLTSFDIHLFDCEVIHPIQTLNTNELSDYISSQDNRYTFRDYGVTF